MKFGVRECCDITFKALDNNQLIGKKYFKKYQPAFMIDTAQTSELSQESTTVYAQGGRGYNRLIAWEGEKTMTFTVTDALMSPMGLSVLSGAGLIDADKQNVVHFHLTMEADIDSNGKGVISHDQLVKELRIAENADVQICTDVDMFATVIDGSGASIDWAEVDMEKTAGESNNNELLVIGEDDDFEFFFVDDEKTKTANKVVVLDFYVALDNGVQTITIEPDSFGGYFYVEGQTLFRREDTGKDMAANFTFPKVKVQSAFTFTMAGSGDPSTFDFTMDAFPGYTMFDRTKKVCCVIDIIGSDDAYKTDVNADIHMKDSPYTGPASSHTNA